MMVRVGLFLLLLLQGAQRGARLMFATAQKTAHLTFACNYAEVSGGCCRTWAGVAMIAAKHVNERNGTLVPQLATEVTNTTIELHAQDRSLYASAYELVKASQQASATKADGYIGFLEDEDVMAAQMYFAEHQSDVPMIGYGAASPAFVTDAAHYENFFSLYPNDASWVEKMAEVFVNSFQWKHFAVIVEQPGGSIWGSQMATVFENKVWSLLGGMQLQSNQSNAVGIVDQYFIQKDDPTTESVDLCAVGLRERTPRVVIHFTKSLESLTKMLEAAMRLDNAGPSAGSAWKYVAPVEALGGAGLVTAKRSYFDAALSGTIGFAEYNVHPAKMATLQNDIWAERMSYGPLVTASGLGLTGAAHGDHSYLEVERRRSMHVLCAARAGYVYDAVVAAALGFEKFANGTETTFAKGLAAGVEFEGLTGPVRGNAPPGLASWPYRRPLGLKFQLLNAHLGELRRKQVFSDASEVRREVMQKRVTGITTAGQGVLGDSMQRGPCFDRNIFCGFGYCSDDESVGFEAGHCVCKFPHFLGQRCIYRSRTAWTEGPLRGKMSAAFARVTWTGFGGYDEHAFEAHLRIEQIYVDQRTRVSNGVLFGTDVLTAEAGSNLWLPRVTVPSCGTVTEESDRLVEVRYPVVYFTYEIHAQNCKIASKWDFYPFDRQHLHLEVVSSPYVTWVTDVDAYTSDHLTSDQEKHAVQSELQELYKTEHSKIGRVKHQGIPERILEEGDWHEGWPPENVVVKLVRRTVLQFDIKIRRDAQLFAIRIFIPACLLGTFAFSTFIVPPEKLVPRFMSGFLAFLALQGFRKSATDDAPDTLIEMGYFDALILFLTVSMSGCVIAVIMGELVYQLYGPLVVADLDRFSRLVTPLCFYSGIVWSLLCAGEDNALGAGVEEYFVGAVTLSVMPLLAWLSWCYLTVANCDHFYLYNCMLLAQTDPAANCVLKDKELSLLFRWIGRKYGFAHHHTQDAAAPKGTRTEEDEDDHLLYVDDVARFVVDTLKGDLELKMCVALTKMIYDAADKNHDGKIDVREWKADLPSVITAASRGDCDLVERSRWYLFCFYLRRFFCNYEPAQLTHTATTRTVAPLGTPKVAASGMNANDPASPSPEKTDAAVLWDPKARPRRASQMFTKENQGEHSQYALLEVCRDQLRERRRRSQESGGRAATSRGAAGESGPSANFATPAAAAGSADAAAIDIVDDDDEDAVAMAIAAQQETPPKA